jgi:hypothetical protein
MTKLLTKVLQPQLSAQIQVCYNNVSAGGRSATLKTSNHGWQPCLHIIQISPHLIQCLIVLPIDHLAMVRHRTACMLEAQALGTCSNVLDHFATIPEHGCVHPNYRKSQQTNSFRRRSM